MPNPVLNPPFLPVIRSRAPPVFPMGRRRFLQLLDMSLPPCCPYLSFAQNAPVSITLCCNAFITVMQAAEVRDRNDPANARDLPSVRTLLRQPEVRPRPMLIGKIRMKSA